MIIDSYEALATLLPNNVAPAMGDPTLFEKILPYIRHAESWVKDNLCDHTSKMWQSDEFKYFIRVAVACDAIERAFSGLDLVMTPNGFGVVSTETIAPASRERTAALRADIVRMRDTNILKAVDMLRRDSLWCAGLHGRLWMRSIISVFDPIYHDDSGSFSLKKYYITANRLSGHEFDIANRSLSAMLLECLREASLRGQSSKLLSQVDGLLRKMDQGYKPTFDDHSRIVDIIRRDSALRVMWDTSRQSTQWELPGFDNDKNSGGFFF